MEVMTIEKHDRVVFDIDGVLAEKDGDTPYAELEPEETVLSRLRSYNERGFYIILYTARNMNSYEGRTGKINAETAPILLDWLHKHDIPYDEIHYGKPWCGHDGFYVDDKAIRPNEFINNSREEILALLEADAKVLD
jgi:capsule biosynthesis phosphatase